jgi:hypothetical protein
VQPARDAIERQRQAELHRHQEERRLDFEQYRSAQAELRETRQHAAALQAKLDFTGAIDRDRVGDALLVGFYFHRRAEHLPSSRKSIFKTAALRLKLMTDKMVEVKLEKNGVHDALEIAYGPIVSEAFDLGFLLSHLSEDGLTETRPEIIGELEKHLRALKLDSQLGDGIGLSEETAGLIKRLAARVITIVRRTS